MIKAMSLISIFLFVICSFPVQAKENSEPINLKRLADNTKFYNATQFLKLKRYDEALQGFNEYLEIYQKGIHRKEAYKNIAKIHFDCFHYLKSVKVNRSLYEEYSNSYEGIEAYYSIGLCYLKMGYYDKAVNVFKSIINEHSGSSYAQSSKIKMDLIDIIRRK